MTVQRADGCFEALLVRAYAVVTLLRMQNQKSGRLVGVNTGVPIQGSSVHYAGTEGPAKYVLNIVDISIISSGVFQRIIPINGEYQDKV